MPAAQEIANGPEAVKRVAAVLPNAMPLISQDQFGSAVRVEPGTIFGGNRFFVTDLGGTVVFAINDKLYTQGKSDFIRDTYLIAIGEGAKRAEWMANLTKAEMTFVMALAGTLAGGLGTAAAALTGIGKLAVFYTKNKTQVDEASKHLKPVLEGLAFVSTRCPKLMWLLTKALGGQVLPAMGQGITLSDVAYFLGKLLGGIGKAPEVTLTLFAKALAAALGLTVVIHGPAMIAHGAPARGKQLAKELHAKGVNVAEADALAACAEGCMNNPEVRKKMQEVLESALKAQPVVDLLTKSLTTSLQ